MALHAQNLFPSIVMSGIAGIYHRDGSRADEILLVRMLRAIAHRGPDGTKHWTHGTVALGQQRLVTTPQARRERLPLCNADATLCLVLDGRVDNRGELKIALTNQGFHFRSDTDAEIVLRAYECWAENCPEKIIGDFAFVLWDERRQQMFCARDVSGVRPFYYFCDARRFLFGSEIPQLFTDTKIPCTPNEAMIGEFLADALTSQTETLYRHIYRLPPAHHLTITADKISLQRYWYPDRLPETRYRRDEEYTEHFRALFTEAVHACLRAPGTIGAHLSGGLDSSSVVCVAQNLLQQGQGSAPKLETFSLVYPGHKCDESQYINEVVQQGNCTAHYLQGDENLVDYSGTFSWPAPPNATNIMGLNKLAQTRGIRVMLTGIGGDEWLAGSPYHYADLLRQGRIFALLQKIRSAQNASHIFHLSHPFWSYGVLPLTRPFVPDFMRAWRRKLHAAMPRPDFITPEFVARIQLAARQQNKDRAVVFKRRAQQHIYDLATGAWQTFRFEISNQIDALFGIEARHPLNDRRLAEFGLALPEEQRWRRTQTKYVLRQALRGTLPDSIRARTDKADFAHLFPAFYQTNIGQDMSQSLALAARGWINAAPTHTLYEQTMRWSAAGDDKYESFTWTLWSLIGLELWYTATFATKNFSSVVSPARTFAV